MLFLIEVSFRQGVRPEEGRPAATMLRERLQKPAPGIKILNSVSDIGGSRLLILADLSDEAMNNLRYTLEFRTLAAVERITYTPVADAKATLDAYLGM